MRYLVSCAKYAVLTNRAYCPHNESLTNPRLFQKAIERAAKLDEQAKAPGFQKPALFGIPVSIKENIKIRNMCSTMGYVQELYKPSKANAALVIQLLHHGSTTNPYNSERVPGGSSGGEAALIATGGSVLGIGSDVGGSIRIPSTFCGIAGFKPSSPRFSHTFAISSIPGRQLVAANEGPMAKSISTCIEYLKVAWSDLYLYEMDPYVPPVVWQEDMFSSEKKLRIGFYTTDGFITPTPANQRAVLEAKKVLEGLGHTLVPFQVPQPQRAFELFVGGVSGDGGRYLNKKLKKDIVLPESAVHPVMLLPISIQRIIAKFHLYPRVKSVLSALPANCEGLQLSSSLPARGAVL
ncbi:Amidase [Cooperia oncophora]